jgi:Zn-dependent protease
MSTPPTDWPPAPQAPPPPVGDPIAGPSPFGEQRPPWWRRFIGWIGAALVAALKFGKAALLLLPKIKLLSTGGTMLVSIAAYTLIWGWQFAVGFVVLLFIHEMGHVIQLRREGIEASAPVFVPFLGALVWAKSLGDNAAAEARVGLAGPVLGSLGAAASWAIGAATGNNLFVALAFTGFFLNLFNLIPVTPLDGGRAFAALSPWMWFVGLFAFALLAFVASSPIMIVFLLIGAFDVYRRWKHFRSDDPSAREYYRVAPRTRLLVAAVYIGLVVLLALGMNATHLQRDIP